jgi:hypothetical protein
MGRIAATFPFQSTVAGGLYAGIASTSHNLEISTFFQMTHTVPISAEKHQQNADLNLEKV